MARAQPDARVNGMAGAEAGYRRDMTVTRDMLATTPSAPVVDAAALAACIDACLTCAQACTACADACLGEDEVADLRRCITSDLGCADICEMTARILSRSTGAHPAITRTALEACEVACRECAEMCEQHADHHDHCRVCAEACRRCQEACRNLLDLLAR